MRPWGVRRLFRFPFRTTDDVRADIREEFAFHLDMRTADLMRTGLSERDARAQALREFGDATAGAADCSRHDERLERRLALARWLGELRQDLAIGWRLLVRSPGFASIAILTLALGLAATVTIFSALDAVLLRPLPYPEPDRLVQVFETLENGSLNSVSGGAFLDWRRDQRAFDSLTLVGRVTYNLRGRGAPERVQGLEASHEFLRVFGIAPLLGRGFSPSDDAPESAGDVVLLTEEMWRGRFGGDPAILGQTIVLDEIPRTIIGVLPAGAWMFREDRFVVPAVLREERAQRTNHWANVFGRLAPGVSVERADAEMKALKARLNPEYPAYKQRWNVAVRSLHELLAGDRRPVLWVLGGAVALVLLIACGNVSNLLLARASTRRQEVALRAALGATGRRLLRQVLTESLVLAALAGVVGVVLAWWGVQLLQDLTADLFPRAMAPRLDLRVLGFALLATILTGLLFGSLPAWSLHRSDLNEALKNGGKNATAGGRHRTQSLLVVGEVALTMILLAGAGLLLRSLARAADADLGFDPQGVLAFDLSLPDATYESAGKRLAFSAELLGRLRSLPGVQSAGAGMAVPFSGGGYGEYLSRPGQDPNGDRITGRVDFITEGYLEALGARLLAGRFYAAADNRPEAPPVVIVNQALASLFFPNENPIGQDIVIYGEPKRIIGLVANIVDRRADLAHRPAAYLPQAANPFRMSIVIRSTREPEAVIREAQRVVQALDPGVPLANIRTLEAAMGDSLADRRVVVGLIGGFAGAALALACIGLYGVMAYTVATRRRELSIRIALGAEERHVARDVLRDGLQLTLAGLVIGAAGALGAGRLLASQLYQVTTHDPLVLCGTIAVSAAVAAAACWLPAWHATRLNPVAALREE